MEDFNAAKNEWHNARRKKMLAAHPEIKELAKPYILTIVYASVLFVAYIALSIYASYLSLFWWSFTGVVIGSSILASLGVLGHDIFHNLGFQSEFNSRLFLLITTPSSLYMNAYYNKRIHHLHHTYLENKYRNPEYPNEAYTASGLFKVRNSAVYRIMSYIPLFMLFDMTLFPMIYKWFNKDTETVYNDHGYWEFVSKILVTEDRWVNAARSWHMIFEAGILFYFGFQIYIWCLLWRVFTELVPNPLSIVRGIAEHTAISDEALKRKQLSFSNYDTILNIVMFNVAYHIEHHDIPNIPWVHLPKLREIAPEFYNNLVIQESWSSIWFRWLKGDPAVSRLNYMPHLRTKEQ